MRINRLASLAFLAVLAASRVCEADDYRLGRGAMFGDDVLLSGYSNVTLDAPRNSAASLSIDDLSLLASGRVNQWINPFLEIELSGVTLWQQGNQPRSNGYVVPERFYDDVLALDSETLRVGKMLSPVGDWNLIHAAPLVPTSTRPLTTYRGFSEYISGLSWIHENSQGRGPDWQLYWQPGNEWFQRPDALAQRHYENVWGGHVNWPMGLVDKLGLSFQRGELTTTDGYYSLLGVNARKTWGKLVLESEAVASRRTGESLAHRSEWGIYGLADYAFTQHWHGIFELEDYQDHQAVRDSRNALLGISYKPQPAVVWKLEYVQQFGESRDIPTGWEASFAVLF